MFDPQKRHTIIFFCFYSIQVYILLPSIVVSSILSLFHFALTRCVLIRVVSFLDQVVRYNHGLLVV